MLSREEIDKKLSAKFLGKAVIFTQANGNEVCGKIGRIGCETATAGEPMAIFTINKTRYEVDVDFFIYNTVICNNETKAGSTGSP